MSVKKYQFEEKFLRFFIRCFYSDFLLFLCFIQEKDEKKSRNTKKSSQCVILCRTKIGKNWKDGLICSTVKFIIQIAFGKQLEDAKGGASFRLYRARSFQRCDKLTRIRLEE